MAGGFDENTTLGVNWSKGANDWMITYPRRADFFLMHDILGSDKFKEFVKELDKRGYDTKTLRFSVKNKKE